MTYTHLQGAIQWAFILHGFCGALALSLFLVPMLSKKGGKTHVRTGWIYTGLMILVCVSAFAITPWRAFVDPERTPSSQSFALFLFFISVLTLSSLSFGIAALREKNRKVPSRSALHLGPTFALIVSALAVELWGLKSQETLLVVFPVLGFFVARKQFLYWRSAPTEKMHWWYAHMSGMFTACIATITAFIVTVVPRLWPNNITRSPVLWLAPGLILGKILSKWTARYRAQFKDSQSSP
jgi:uncharacterized membrane protein